jgi:hypothetical protein
LDKLGKPFRHWLKGTALNSSNCERVFKEFAKQHTKARNRLKQKTVVKLAQVKYHLRRKYPMDYSARSKNRAISPKEHLIIENDAIVMAGGTDVTVIELDCEESDKKEEVDDDDGVVVVVLLFCCNCRSKKQETGDAKRELVSIICIGI